MADEKLYIMMAKTAVPMDAEPPVEWERVNCPFCGAECWKTPLHETQLRANENATLACSVCAVAKAGTKAVIPSIHATDEWPRAVKAAERYKQECRIFRAKRSLHPSPNWRAFLAIATSDDGIWNRMQPRINYEKATVDFDGIQGLQTQEQLLLDLARCVYEGAGTIAIADLADFLDDHQWKIAMDALRIYRDRTAPTGN